MKSGYIRQTWDFGSSREIEEKHTGRYGARGQPRRKKRKATREDIKAHNQWKRRRDVRRLVKWNFRKNDYWMTVTYKKGERPSAGQIKKDIQNLLKNARYWYRKFGWELKYVYRIGIGKRGGPHIHVLVNRESGQGTGTDLIFNKLWKNGHINFKHLYEEGDFRQLAEYLTKPLEEWEPEILKNYSPSRNLIRKEPREKVVNRRSLADKNGNPFYPKAPKGYYIDPESVEMGVSRVTGYLYRRYTLVKLDRRI